MHMIGVYCPHQIPIHVPVNMLSVSIHLVTSPFLVQGVAYTREPRKSSLFLSFMPCATQVHKLVLTFPVSSITAERSFYSLHLIKTFLRSSMM